MLHQLHLHDLHIYISSNVNPYYRRWKKVNITPFCTLNLLLVWLPQLTCRDWLVLYMYNNSLNSNGDEFEYILKWCWFLLWSGGRLPIFCVTYTISLELLLNDGSLTHDLLHKDAVLCKRREQHKNYIWHVLKAFHIPPYSNFYSTIWYNYEQVFCLCNMHFANHTQQHGVGGGPLPINLILCLHCYLSLIWCICLTKIMLILPQVLFFIII